MLIAQLLLASFWGTIDVTLAFWSFSLALNVAATVLVAGRLYYYRRRVVGALKSAYGLQYTSVIAMVIESELLYTCILGIQLPLFAIQHPVSNVISQIVPQVQVLTQSDHLVSRLTSNIQAIAALMIVYRVAQGQAWTKDTHAMMSNAGAVKVQLANPPLLCLDAQTTKEVLAGKGGITDV